ncbi:hypothetical protein [Stenotrophomonas sp. 22385]|uniref:hypothetical protein n=1 Tax=Stenotrophomonas sp. 22385 TaxID=3453915 RepID=UPI003F83EC6E
MASVIELLDTIDKERESNPRGAEEQLNELMQTLGSANLQKWLPQLEASIGNFLPKRRRRLQSALALLLESSQEQDSNAMPTADEHEAADRWKAEVVEELHDLSEFHIFQWPTYYREWVGNSVEIMLNLAPKLQDEAMLAFQSAVAAHSKEIFEKGFTYKVVGQRRGEDSAHVTALSGVQRFADLAVEFYSGGAIKEAKGERRVALRRATSRLLAGILSGFIACNFKSKSGAQVLASSRVRWFHYLTFLDSHDLGQIAEQFGSGSISQTLARLVRPLAFALDRCAESATSSHPLPQVSQYFHEKKRLEVLCVSSSAKRVVAKSEVFVLLDPELPPVSDLREAESRDISLVICSLKPDVARSSQAERMQEKIVDTNEGNQTPSEFEQRACAILTGAFSIISEGDREAILEYNFARGFPLNNPFQTKYFHVVRKSVRNLLQEIEGRNGVRLWCSARRSGKTTACNDLSGSLASSETVVQTCEVLRQDDLSGRLYGRIIDCIENEEPIGRRFLTDIIDEVRQGSGAAAKTVLVIDEYETLFGRLRGAVRRQEDIKYSIVFPLLDQIVEFARENMVILVGQQPNAHFVFMDQNKLSAYVTQDSFPLFRHATGSTTGEFVDLLAKVISERFGFTAGFADKLFQETAGHPFLTVNMIVSMVDWLIARRVRVSDIRFDAKMLEQYFEEDLSHQDVALNTEYQFFLEAAADAMSETGKSSNPWLWSVYKAMRMFVISYGVHERCEIAEFSRSYDKAGLNSSGISSLEMLRTAEDANFFKIDSDNLVRLAIPLLGRITAAATPRIC